MTVDEATPSMIILALVVAGVMLYYQQENQKRGCVEPSRPTAAMTAGPVSGTRPPPAAAGPIHPPVQGTQTGMGQAAPRTCKVP